MKFSFFIFFFNFLFYCINLPHRLYHKSHAAFLVQCNNTFSHLIRVPHAKGKLILLNRKYYKLAKLANLRVQEKHFCIYFSMILEQIIVQVNVMFILFMSTCSSLLILQLSVKPADQPFKLLNIKVQSTVIFTFCRCLRVGVRRSGAQFIFNSCRRFCINNRWTTMAYIDDTPEILDHRNVLCLLHKQKRL